MVRFTIFGLCLVIFFLVGMLFGIDRQADHHIGAPTDNMIDPVEYGDAQDVEIEQMQIQKLNQQNQSPHFTQKLATGLEKIVTGFYEGVVQIIYQISSLLF